MKHKNFCVMGTTIGDVALATALNANLLIFTSSRQMYITPELEVDSGNCVCSI